MLANRRRLRAAVADGRDARRRRACTCRRRRAACAHELSALFALDALGGGFLTTALLSYFFATHFGASAATIGGLFFSPASRNDTRPVAHRSSASAD
jgi:hypothetical protein